MPVTTYRFGDVSVRTARLKQIDDNKALFACRVIIGRTCLKAYKIEAKTNAEAARIAREKFNEDDGSK